MHRTARLLAAIAASLLAVTIVGELSGGRALVSAGGATEVTVNARLTGWVARRDGFHLYRENDTVRAPVVVWPDLQGEKVWARLEWRRAGRSWAVLDVSSVRLNLDSRGLFVVRGLPAGYAFRLSARVPARNGHRADRSSWRYFRVG
ncbi:MAG TPA: hypothetical protein VNC60_10440 [Actinomycetota bacterium]|nr:hypothetical protein [Actinomycetota bacterium]